MEAKIVDAIEDQGKLEGETFETKEIQKEILLVRDSTHSDQQPASPGSPPNQQPGIIAEPQAIPNDAHSEAPQPVIEGSLNTQPSQQEPTLDILNSRPSTLSGNTLALQSQ